MVLAPRKMKNFAGVQERIENEKALGNLCLNLPCWTRVNGLSSACQNTLNKS